MENSKRKKRRTRRLAAAILPKIIVARRLWRRDRLRWLRGGFGDLFLLWLGKNVVDILYSSNILLD